MSGGIIALIVIGGILLICLLWLAISYNVLTKLKVGVEEAVSAMDVQMKKRCDLVPNFVNTVKGYAKYEKELLENVVKYRNLATSASNSEEKIKADGALSGAITKLFAVAENYPELKADTNFKDLQSTLKEVETEIAASRRYYNAVVKSYNIKVRVFPSNLVANMFKFKSMPMYEIEDKTERANVNVEF